MIFLYSFQRPLFVLADRNVDMATPLHHTWTYQALIHDVLVSCQSNKYVTHRSLLPLVFTNQMETTGGEAVQLTFSTALILSVFMAAGWCVCVCGLGLHTHTHTSLPVSQRISVP